jgi:D-threo-aldose 1-dehydrogenase
MRRVHLKRCNIETSCLGFGCVSLTMHDDRAKAIHILETAFDAGITHFDVARLYGYGQAEGILGEFLQGKRDRVTVTTKFGLEPAGAVAKSRKLVSIARWIAHRSKFIAKFARRASAANVAKGKFNPADAKASLETSLRELRTDHIDLFMLHECSLEEAQQQDLIAFLQGQKSKGTIRGFGPAVAFDKLKGDASLFPAQHAVMQFDSSSTAPNIELLKNAAARDCITFGPIAAAKKLAELVKSRPQLATPYQAQISANLQDPDAVAGLMLRDALTRNADGIVLFASTNKNRVAANVAAAVSPSSDQEISGFRQFVNSAVSLLTPVSA